VSFRQQRPGLLCEGIVSKRLGSLYRSGRSPHWIKVKNPNAPAVKREAEEDWGEREMRPRKLSPKFIHRLAADRCVSAASAQSCWYNGDYGLKQRGYYGTPYGGGPQYSSGGGDQYGYGPAYSYAKQAPEPSPFAPTPCVWRRVWNEHHWVRSCI